MSRRSSAHLPREIAAFTFRSLFAPRDVSIARLCSAWVDGAEVVGTFDMFALTVNELKALQL